MEKILKIAHRGASGYEPENTLKAIQKAVHLGADMIEVDVRRTRDRHIVAFHDYTLHRLTNGYGRLRKYTYHELKHLSISGEEIPTLLEILRLVRGYCQMNIEIKERRLVKDLADMVLSENMERDVLFSSFLHFELAKLKAISSDFRVALLFSQLPSIPLAIKLAREIQAEALNLPLRRITYTYLSEIVNKANKMNIKINIWTANDRGDIEWLKKLGVHGIITDYPDRI